MTQKRSYQILDSTTRAFAFVWGVWDWHSCEKLVRIDCLRSKYCTQPPYHLWRFASKTAWWRDATFEVVLFPFIDKDRQTSVSLPWGGGPHLPVTLAQTLYEPNCILCSGGVACILVSFLFRGCGSWIGSMSFVCLSWADVEKISICKWGEISCLTSLPL